jgi:hypothetical protein
MSIRHALLKFVEGLGQFFFGPEPEPSTIFYSQSNMNFER